MLPPELIVEIRKVGDEEYLAVTKRAGGREVCHNRFRFEPGLLVDLEPQWLLDRAVPRHTGETVKRGPADAARLAEEERKLADYGRRLYGFLFGDENDDKGKETRAKFQAFLEYNDIYRRQARLTLALHPEAAALWRLPWEYLHDGNEFLACSGRFLLSRVPEGLGQIEPPPVPLPLRVLVIVSAPDDQAPLDTEEEIGAIQEALDEAVRAGRVRVEYLDDATLEAVGDSLRRFKPHVVHYTGHGAYDREKKNSFLALENEAGRTRRAGIDELKPHLAGNRDLRLVVLSGCHTARTSDVDALGGVATGLLALEVPAVVAMQASILDQSGIELAGALYAALAEGATPVQAVQRARTALQQFEEGPGYDWGVPALYLRAQGMRLIDVDADVGAHGRAPLQRAAAIDVGGLPLPPHFVGRKAELRTLRRALRERPVTAAFVRGIGGMGKSSLAAKLLQRPGVELDGALVVRCQEVDALDVPAKVAHFLAAQGRASHAEAAGLLLDSRLDPRDRARQALEMVADRSYVLVFDNFESLMEVPDQTSEVSENLRGLEAAFEVADPGLAGLLAGLVGARWWGLCLFTGRYRWRALDEALGRGTAVEVHLPALTGRQAIMLMDNLPRLRQEPLKTKVALYKKVGGHPKSIELLEGWLAAGRVTDLLADPALDGLLARHWEDYFLRALLGQLPAGEAEALQRLSIFRTRLDEEEFDYARVEAGAVARWLDLSLLQRELVMPPDLPQEMAALLALLLEAERRKLERAETYSVHPVVGEYLLGRLDEAARRELHAWAAAYQGRPFVEAARQYAAQTGQKWTEEEIERVARLDRGVVGQMVHRTDDLGQARGAMARALEWQHHLFQAGAYEAADDIVNAVWMVLARWGQRDRAKALLRASVETQEGLAQAAAQGNLATLLMDEGKLDEALATYEAVYATFEGLGARQQMAAVLGQISYVYQDKGEVDKGIEKSEEALKIRRQIGDEEGQAISLHQLSMLYRHQGDYGAALARSEETEALFRKLGIEAHVASTLHEQGLILNRMARAEEGGEEAAADRAGAHRAAAAERFRQSLAIKRRIGNEAGAATTLNELGKLLLDAGQMPQAIDAQTEALEIFRRMNNPAKVGITLEFLGRIHEDQRQYAAALEKYREALGLLQQYGSPQDRAIVENDIARVQGKMGG